MKASDSGGASTQAQQCCKNCRFFNGEPAVLEASIPGLRVMGSAYSAVVHNDGLCARHDRYLSGTYHCGDFQAR